MKADKGGGTPSVVFWTAHATALRPYTVQSAPPGAMLSGLSAATPLHKEKIDWAMWL